MKLGQYKLRKVNSTTGQIEIVFNGKKARFATEHQATKKAYTLKAKEDGWHAIVYKHNDEADIEIRKIRL